MRKAWYTLTYEDIECVASDRKVKLSKREIEQVANVASEMMGWHETVNSAIGVVLSWR